MLTKKQLYIYNKHIHIVQKYIKDNTVRLEKG